MLKRLELVGFKSFADKTQLEFDQGITAIVGPNGSGKSNVVDALKWVLGEQSAKSLRGGEMADVIFNGSATRRPAGMAEVTLTFDNSRRLLPLDCDEVHITRRVHRNGEGEYLINRQASRLRDIKELFMGTGAGAEAYAVIEQGKVDVFLQASTRDRRAIFEEAAGISRFKAKKNEALRKLERTQQNLDRLNDIIEEVDKQLRSVKYQAAKAKRFQEYNARLRELRVSLSLSDYHALTVDEQQLTQALDHLADQVRQAAAQTESLQKVSREAESAVMDLADRLRQAEAALADRRAELAGLDSAMAYERRRLAEAHEQVTRGRREIGVLRTRIAELQEAVRAAADQRARLDAQRQRWQEAIDEAGRLLEAVSDQVRAVAAALEQDRAALEAAAAEHGRIHSQLASLISRLDLLTRDEQRLGARGADLGRQTDRLAFEHQRLTAAEEAILSQLMERRCQARALARDRRSVDHEVQGLAAELAALNERRTAVASRLELLTEMDRRQEGLGQGVREALEALRARQSAWSGVIGVLADHLETDIEHAPVLEAALGPAAQYIVVEHRSTLAGAIQEIGPSLTGPVTFLCLDRLPPTEPLREVDLRRYYGVLGRAVDLVRAPAALAPAVDYLLGRTLVVRDLGTALALSGDGLAGCRFVTPAGDVVEPDGTVTTGPPARQGGLIWRRSQVRELNRQQADLEAEIGQQAGRLEQLRRRLDDLAQGQLQLQTQIGHLHEQARQSQAEARHRQAEQQRLMEEAASLEQELASTRRELEAGQTQRRRLQGALAQAQAERTRLAARVEAGGLSASELKAQADQVQQLVYERRVELAKVDERLAAVERSAGQLAADLAERQRQLADVQGRLAEARRQIAAADLSLLQQGARQASLYLLKEAAERQVAELVRARDAGRTRLAAIGEQLEAARSQWHDFQEALHARQLEVHEARLKRENLESRLRDDYQVELSALYASYDPAAGVDLQAITDEVEQLRRKIASLGSVNLEAIEELEQTQARSDQLHYQYNDLLEAKRGLEGIIEKINHDSRQLFTETFESVRGHFQELFRKLFGGGKADILLEDPTDVLESGIEIIARPPGKEPQRLSLLSGGERTLTAVALLLAIFRSKPSPFCLLDEVDAALDEANIDRFVSLLDEFTQHSQFIIISHSKKTMTAAHVLYGITMQESGVSKKVSVRFEDVSDTGEFAVTEAKEQAA